MRHRTLAVAALLAAAAPRPARAQETPPPAAQPAAQAAPPRPGGVLRAHLTAPGEASVSFTLSRPAYVAVLDVYLARGPRLVYASDDAAPPLRARLTQATASHFSLRSDTTTARGARRYLLLVASTEPFTEALDRDGEGFLKNFPSAEPLDVTNPTYVADVIARDLLAAVAHENMAASVLEIPRVDLTFADGIRKRPMLRCGGRTIGPASGVRPADVCAATAPMGRP